MSPDKSLQMGSTNPTPELPSKAVGGEGAATPSALDRDPATSCRLVLELLPEAVGGDLDADTDLAIARHVSGCHSCGREWASLRRAHRALTSLREGNEGQDGASGLDDAFFAELHQDILGEVRYRQQLDTDQRLFANAQQAPRPLPEAPQSGLGVPLALSGFRKRMRGTLLHVASLAAAILLGILIGKQFEAPVANPESNSSGSTPIKVRDGSLGGPMRGAGDVTVPRVKRIDQPATDEEFRAWLDRQMKDLYLPQPVSPAPLILEPSTGDSKRGAVDKKGQDF